LAQAVRSVVAPVEAGTPWVARVVSGTTGDVLHVSVSEGDPTLAAIRVTREASDGEKPAALEGVEEGEARFLLPPAPAGTGTARARISSTTPVASTAAADPAAPTAPTAPTAEGGGGAPGAPFPPITYAPTGVRDRKVG